MAENNEHLCDVHKNSNDQHQHNRRDFTKSMT